MTACELAGRMVAWMQRYLEGRVGAYQTEPLPPLPFKEAIWFCWSFASFAYCLDAFELSLVKMGMQRGLPILAICRGSQALNVACGGTLHQHIPGHRQTALATEATHKVEIDPRSRLHRIIRTRTVGGNSFHHQAVDQVGEGLRVVARAGRHDRGDRGRRLHRRRAVARRDARGAFDPLRGARYGGFPYRTARRRMTPWGACPPSRCVASSSASARSPPSTISTSTCPRARASACSAPTARASPRRCACSPRRRSRTRARSSPRLPAPEGVEGRARRSAASCPQLDNLDVTLTVEQNLLVFAHLYRIARARPQPRSSAR